MLQTNCLNIAISNLNQRIKQLVSNRGFWLFSGMLLFSNECTSDFYILFATKSCGKKGQDVSQDSW